MTLSSRLAWWTRFGTLLAMAGLAGCSTPSWLCLSPPGPTNVSLIVAPDANNHAAVAVDLLMITDLLAAQQIGAISAQDYFNRRPQLLRDYSGQIRVRSWELTPGQIARDVPVSQTCNRVRTLIFVRYATPGDHRQVLGPAQSIVISLDVDDFKVSP